MTETPPVGDPEGDEVGYDLEDWTPEQRQDVLASLVAEGVAARFEDVELVVPEKAADLAEQLIDEIDDPDALEAATSVGDVDVDDVDAADEADGGEVLSTLFIASDVLLHDPDSSAAVVELLQAADVVAAMGAPFGVDDIWPDVQRAVEELADALGDEGDEDEAVAAARRLRDLLRPMV